MSATVSSMNLRKKFHRLTYICSIWSQQNYLDHTPLLFQNGTFGTPKTRFEAVLRSKSSSRTRFAKRLKVWIYSRNFSISNYMLFGYFNSTRRLNELNQRSWPVGRHVYNMKTSSWNIFHMNLQNDKKFSKRYSSSQNEKKVLNSLFISEGGIIF